MNKQQHDLITFELLKKQFTMQKFTIEELNSLKNIATRERDALEYLCSEIQQTKINIGNWKISYVDNSNVVYWNNIIEKLEIEILKF